MEKQQKQENIPEKKFSTGAISATIWKNKATGKTGQEIEFRAITLQRRYKDKNDQWQSTNSLRVNDLPKAVLVLNKAYEFLVLRDKEQEISTDEDIFEEIVM